MDIYYGIHIQPIAHRRVPLDVHDQIKLILVKGIYTFRNIDLFAIVYEDEVLFSVSILNFLFSFQFL